MSDYLNSLVARTLRLAPVVQPRPTSLFEPVASGPFPETAFEAAETRTTQEVIQPAKRAATELPEMPVQRQEHVAMNEPPHAVLPSQTMPAPLLPMPPSPFRVDAIENSREVREGELPRRSADSDATIPASETRHNQTASVIKPEVRITSSATDRAPVQPLTTPPLAPVFPPESLSRPRNISAQAAEPAEGPETVVVTIGRVDVRAIFAPPQAAPHPNRTASQPMSLDDYLKQRSEGRR
ncbi:MAG TPA: hypothetical protein VHS05_12965 [Pyrinomonadaceae bacterium]|jgi:hypothetical protein|nr:hypothetical protein [Pyrinomonadaceae bacterium]